MNANEQQNPAGPQEDPEDIQDRLDEQYASVVRTRLAARLLREWQEYVREAEHQEGPGYWRRFTTDEEALIDFGVGLQAIYEDHNPNDPADLYVEDEE